MNNAGLLLLVVVTAVFLSVRLMQLSTYLLVEMLPLVPDNPGKCLSIGRPAVSLTDGEEKDDHWKNQNVVLCDPNQSAGPSGGLSA